MKTILVLLVLFLIFSLALVKLILQDKVTEDNSLRTNTENIPDTTIEAWIAWWDEEDAIISLNKSGNILRNISPVWYKLDENAQITQTDSKVNTEISQIAFEKGIRIIPSITNADEEGFNAFNVSNFLHNERSIENAIDELIAIALTEDYAGWDLDWEEIEEEDRDLYSSFVNKLATGLHQKGLILSVTVHPQTGKSTDWSGAKGHDWKALGNSADYVRIMAYDFHNINTKPGPITPTDNLTDVLKFAIKTIPEEKIVIGLPVYGYNWSNVKVSAVSYNEAVDLFQVNGEKHKRDNKSFELTGTLKVDNVEHTLWFQDAESVKRKIEFIRNFGIYQFVIWKLGDEDENFWK